MTKNRIEWIDVLKYICITLVLIDHWEGCPKVFITFFEPFYLTCFFFASGYCYKHKDDFKSLMYKKFRTLFIPWLVFSYANIFLSHIISFNEHEDLLTEIIRNALQIRAYDDRLWFLACLFVTFIPFFFIIKKYEENHSNEKKILLYVFVIVLVIDFIRITLKINDIAFPWGNRNLPWHLQTLMNSAMFMYLGYLYRTKYEEKLKKYVRLDSLLIVAIIFVGLFVVTIKTNIESYEYVSILFKYIKNIVGITMIVLLSKFIKTNKFISFVGMNTLIYFSTHNKMETIVDLLLNKFVGGFYDAVLSNTIYSILFSFVYAFVVSLLLIVPTILINKFMPRTLGKK